MIWVPPPPGKFRLPPTLSTLAVLSDLATVLSVLPDSKKMLVLTVRLLDAEVVFPAKIVPLFWTVNAFGFAPVNTFNPAPLNVLPLAMVRAPLPVAEAAAFVLPTDSVLP